MLFGRTDRKPIKIQEMQVAEWKYTTCGYCTWVCPYNAPQLDPIEG